MKNKKPKHTPGPWRVDNTWGLIIAGENDEIAACHSGIEANANLISAAPDMLEALKLVCENVNLDFDELCAVKSAIRKARGES